MTFGIDIASPQKDIDLARARAEGAEFVIVKMGGLNVKPQYVAPHYKNQIIRADAAGLPKGHYYLIGKGETPEQQAEFMADNLHLFDRAHDVLAVDNEHLDSNGTFWEQGDAVRFLKRLIEKTGIAPERVWHYAGASASEGGYRNRGPWDQVEALGVRIWWSAYGGGPSGRTPDHTPALQGSVTDWDIHQYSSRVSIAGYNLDGNYSRISVSDLFGGAAPSTPTGGTNVSLVDNLINWAKAHPKRDGGTWDQWCGSLLWRLTAAFGTAPDPTPPSAIAAARATTIISTNADAAPIGAVHYWDIGKYGHVAAGLGGQSVLMASRRIQTSFGDAIGLTTVRAYTSATGARYLGWSLTYGKNGRFAGAGSPVPPKPNNGGGQSSSGGALRSSTADDGVPGKVFWTLFQRWAADHGYTGPKDGVPGVNSWKAIQQHMRPYGYSGPVDGLPGKGTWAAVQRWASEQGDYRGPRDGAPGGNTYKSMAKIFNRVYATKNA